MLGDAQRALFCILLVCFLLACHILHILIFELKLFGAQLGKTVILIYKKWLASGSNTVCKIIHFPLYWFKMFTTIPNYYVNSYIFIESIFKFYFYLRQGFFFYPIIFLFFLLYFLITVVSDLCIYYIFLHYIGETAPFCKYVQHIYLDSYMFLWFQHLSLVPLCHAFLILWS